MPELNVAISIGGENVKAIDLVVAETKGVDLNFVRFTVPNSTREEEFTRADEVIIQTDDNNTLVEFFDFLEGNDKVTPFSFIDNTFNHEITCVERAWKLEKYTGITRVYTANGIRTLWDIVFELQQTVPHRDLSRILEVPFEIGSEIDFLKEIIAPDIIFNENTLREALIIVFDEADAYPILKLKTGTDFIDTIFYNERVNRVDKKTGTAYRTQIADVTDYSSYFEVNASNMVNAVTPIGGSAFEPGIDEFKGLRNNTSPFVSTGSYLESNWPKYRKIQVLQRIPTANDGIIVVDISDHVVESDVRELYLDDAIFPDAVLGKYKSNTVIWDFGSDRIEGWFETFGIINSDPVWERIVKSKLAEIYGTDLSSPPNYISEFVNQEFYELEYNIIYVPNFDAKMHVERIDNDDITRVAGKNFNQDSNFTAPTRLLKSMFSQLQKRGSDEYISTRVIEDLSELYDLNYFTADKYVLNGRELHYGIYTITVNEFWTKNDNKAPARTEINSKLELFDIPGSERQLSRKEVYKEYIIAEATLGGALPDEDSTFLNVAGLRCILNILRQNPVASYDRPPLAAAIQSPEIDLYEDPLTGVSEKLGSRYISTPIQSWGGRGSLSVMFNFNRPNIAGTQRVVISSKQTLRGVRYTDKNSELEKFDVDLVHAINVDKDEYPVISAPLTSPTVQANDIVLRKQAGEITSETYQVQIQPINADEIGFGDLFFERNNFVEFKNGTFVQLFASEVSRRVGRYERNVADIVTVSAGNWSFIDDNRLQLDVASSAEAWVLTDIDGNLYFYANQRNLDGSFTFRRTITFRRYIKNIKLEALT